MFLKYFYNDVLAHASYMVGCQADGTAIVIDPARDVKPYLAVAKSEGMRIVGVTETHIHADFVSGARELAETTRATLYLSAEGGSEWGYEYTNQYKYQPLRAGTIFHVGKVSFEVMHTPGHTPEHISLLVTDNANSSYPIGIFTGDFVFVGDVGRPDLLERVAGVAGSSELMARNMFQSLQRFRGLSQFLQVWPAHGAGSACGKALGAIPSTTVGYENLVNWALQQTDVMKFSRDLLGGQPEAPVYFARMKRVNKEGPTLLLSLPEVEQVGNSVDLLQEWLSAGQVLDVRSATLFARGHLRGSLNIPLNKSFVTWAGWLLDYERPIYVLCSANETNKVLHELRSIGFDKVMAIMDSSVLDSLPEKDISLQGYCNVEPHEVADAVARGEVCLLDVRNTSEWEKGHIPEARHLMLGHLQSRISEIPLGRPVLVQCKSGGRSAIAASLLQANGFEQVLNLTGGYDRWIREGFQFR